MTVEWRLRSRDGTWRYAETVVTNRLGDAAVGGLVMNSRDVSDRRALEEQLRRHAFHDPLTRLANRALFDDRLSHALARGFPDSATPAVLYVDLDGFKSVNDAAGRDAGDDVLTEVARRISACVRPGDTVGRLGGDEFAVLLDSVAGPDEALTVAARVHDALASRFDVRGRPLRVKASIGVALPSRDDYSARELLRDADVAMSLAKGEGKGRSKLFDPAMHAPVVDRLALEADLAVALAKGQFFLQYQPVVDLGSGRWLGAEALLRWRHPTRGTVAPGDFIPLAETAGIMVDIGDWVLQTACEQLAAWRKKRPDLVMNINLSAYQLHAPDLAARITEITQNTGVPPQQVVLDITEAALVDGGEEMVEVLGVLAGTGVQIAIDDFGTVHSSSSFISRLPVQELKIDRSFVGEMSEQHDNAAIVDSFIRFAHRLRLNIVAEGIEDNETASALRDLGCEQGQGFLFAQPYDPDILEQLFQKEDHPADDVGARAWAWVRERESPLPWSAESEDEALGVASAEGRVVEVARHDGVQLLPLTLDAPPRRIRVEVTRHPGRS